jgi:hypothetical protein
MKPVYLQAFTGVKVGQDFITGFQASLFDFEWLSDRDSWLITRKADGFRVVVTNYNVPWWTPAEEPAPLVETKKKK